MPETFPRYDSTKAHDRGASAYRSALSGADATTFGTPLSSGSLLRATEGRQTLAVSVRFSGAAADTVDLFVVLYSQIRGTTTLLGYHTEAAVTAAAPTDANSDNLAPVQFFDLSGASHYEIRVGAPSAGNVDLHAWEF